MLLLDWVSGGFQLKTDKVNRSLEPTARAAPADLRRSRLPVRCGSTRFLLPTLPAVWMPFGLEPGGNRCRRHGYRGRSRSGKQNASPGRRGARNRRATRG